MSVRPGTQTAEPVGRKTQAIFFCDTLQILQRLEQALPRLEEEDKDKFESLEA